MKKNTKEQKINAFLLVFLIVIGILSIIIGMILGKNILKFLNEPNTLENILKENYNNIANEKEYSDELFGKYYKKAEELLNTMTLEEKVGQMFLVRYPYKGVINEIITHNPGGYTLYGKDFDAKTKTSMIEELKNCQKNSKINLFLAVDEEGGTVTRVSSHKAFRDSKFLSPQRLYARGQLELILQDSKEKSELLKSIGLNMNLAPVADVSTTKTDFIYDRSFGKGAEETSEFISALIESMNESEMISSMKHFPGHGNNIDTHKNAIIDERPYETFETSDFLPFKAGIDAKAPTILISHNVVKCMDEQNPASLSKRIHRILREDLGFSGIILTDDLAMLDIYGLDEGTAVQAVLAGNDLIMTSDFVKQKQEVIAAVYSGEISQDYINEAVRRILACKYAYKIKE